MRKPAHMMKFMRMRRMLPEFTASLEEFVQIRKKNILVYKKLDKLYGIT